MHSRVPLCTQDCSCSRGMGVFPVPPLHPWTSGLLCALQESVPAHSCSGSSVDSMAIPFTGESRHSTAYPCSWSCLTQPWVYPCTPMFCGHCVLWGPGTPELLCVPQGPSMHQRFCVPHIPCTSVHCRVPAPQSPSMHPEPLHEPHGPSVLRESPGLLHVLGSPCTPELLHASQGLSMHWGTLWLLRVLGSPGTPEPLCVSGDPCIPQPAHALGSSVHFTATPCTGGTRHPRACPCNPEPLHALEKSVHPVAALWSSDPPESLRAPGTDSVLLRAAWCIPSPGTQRLSLRPEPLHAPGTVRASGDSVHHMAAPLLGGLCTPELLRAP